MAEPFADWIGRSVEAGDIATPGPVERLAAMPRAMAAPGDAGVVPPFGHWLHHLPDTPREALGGDGRPAVGGFLPPMTQPRRMRAGGRLHFLAPSCG